MPSRTSSAVSATPRGTRLWTVAIVPHRLDDPALEPVLGCAPPAVVGMLFT